MIAAGSSRRPRWCTGGSPPASSSSACPPERGRRGAGGLGAAPVAALSLAGVRFGMGVLMWPVMAFYTSSTIHMLAHGSWAQAMMLAGAAELGVARGKLHSRYWRLCSAFALAVSGLAVLVHEQNHWLFSRAAFLHHVLGWSMFSPRSSRSLQSFRPRSSTAGVGFATTFILLAVLLYRDRDTAPIFGHLDFYAGVPTGEEARPPRAGLAALAAPASASRTRRSCRRRRRCARGSRARRRRSCSRTTSPWTPSASARRPRREGRQRRRAAAAKDQRRARRVAAGAPAGRRVHRPLARALERRPRRLGRLHLRLRVPAPPVTEAVGAQGPTGHRARRPLALLPRARAAARRARVPAARRAAACAAAARRAALLAESPELGAVAVLEVGISRLHAPCRGRAPAAARRLPLRRPLLARERDALRDRRSSR